MNRRRLLRRIQAGHPRNIRFSDLTNLVEGLGFRLDRIRGSHHIYVHPVLDDALNLQPRGGQAKEYQVRQLLNLIERYNLELEDSED